MDDDARRSLDSLAAKYHQDLRRGRTLTPPEEDAWPNDHPDWVFLARAIRQLGAHRHGAKWTGEEGRRFSRIAFPRYEESWQPRYREARRQAHRLLLAHSDYIACPIVSEPDVAPSHAFTDYNHSEIMWRRAEAIRLQTIRNGEEGLKRLRSIEVELLGMLRDETVRTALRGRLSLNFQSVPSDMWSIIDTASAMVSYSCKIQEENLEGSKWIFINRNDFANLLQVDRKLNDIVPANVKKGNVQATSRERELLEKRVASWPLYKPAPGADADREWIEAQIGRKLDRKSFRALRAQVVPAEWLKPGRHRLPKL